MKKMKFMIELVLDDSFTVNEGYNLQDIGNALAMITYDEFVKMRDDKITSTYAKGVSCKPVTD